MARHDVDITGFGLGAREDAGAVHPLTPGEHLDEVLTRVDRKSDRLETPVAPDIAQVHLAQLQLLHGPDKIAAREVSCRLLEQAHERVGFEDVVWACPVLPVTARDDGLQGDCLAMLQSRRW